MYNKRQELILDYIKDNPATKREDIETFLMKMGYNTTKMTITRDLKLLLENGDIEKSGQAKATVYNPSVKVNLLNDVNIETYFDKEQDERLPGTVGFNFPVNEKRSYKLGLQLLGIFEKKLKYLLKTHTSILSLHVKGSFNFD